MPTVGDYSIILQGAAETPHGLDNAFSWNLPSSAHLGSRSILSFRAKVSGGPAKIDITINEKGIGWFKLSDWFGALTRIVNGNVLRHGENLVRFHLSCEDYCYVNISDVAIHWQNSI